MLSAHPSKKIESVAGIEARKQAVRPARGSAFCVKTIVVPVGENQGGTGYRSLPVH